MVQSGSSAPPITHFPLEHDPDEDEAPHQLHDTERVANAALTPAVISDVDGTLIRWQMFDDTIKLGIEYGIFPKVLDLLTDGKLAAYQDRQGPFGAWVDARVAAYQLDGRLKDIRISDVITIAKELVRRKGQRVHIFTRELLYAAADVGMERAFVSGTMIQVVRELGKAHDVHIVIGTEHEINESTQRFTGDEHKRIEWVLKKDKAIQKLASEHHIDLENSVAIGDTFSDVAMLELVKWPICFDPNPGLETVARERKWPIVDRAKLKNRCYIPDDAGMLHEASYADILPQPLAAAFGKRFQAALAKMR